MAYSKILIETSRKYRTKARKSFEGFVLYVPTFIDNNNNEFNDREF